MEGRRVAIAAVAAAAAFGSPASAAGPRALTVLPPGEGSRVTLSAFAQNQASGNCADLGPHVCDQLDTYKNWGFKTAPLSASPSQVPAAVSDEKPADGVEIVRDGAGVPHVFAKGPDEPTIEQRLAYGFGYAQAEERLFQMDILRRAAEGRLSDLVGPTYIEMDELLRRDSETDAERAGELNLLTPSQRTGLQSYVSGINAVIARATQNPGEMPAGFTLTQDLPIAPWTVNDSLAILGLEVRNVAESAGNELGYGSLARRLARRYGLRRAVAILDDVQLTHERDAPTTVPSGQRARRTTDRRRYSFIRYTRRDSLRLIRALAPSVEPAHQRMLHGELVHAQANRTFGLPVFGSNAWAVSPRRSTTGGALLWGGPQVSYYIPAVLDEIETQGGLYHVRGVAVPGAGPAVTIGYTRHLAWSITSAQDDQTDTYVDRIRPAAGGRYEYRWRGRWLPVEQRLETIRSRMQSPPVPIVGQVAPPTYTTRTVTVYRTTHGSGAARLPCVVVYLDTARGLSYCKERAFWGAEIGTGLAVVGFNSATNLSAFGAAARRSVAGFNFIYADDAGHIAYWHGGRIPLRVRGHDPRLPVPGDGRYDWRGFLDPHLWPSVVDPAQGFLASWNNKPQRSWDDAGDGSLWGHYQRSRQPMRLLAARRRLGLNGLWGVARRTGELDLRASLGFKPFLTRLRRLHGLSRIERAAVGIVARWDGTAFYPGGAERTASGVETGRVRGAAFPIMSAWFHALERRVSARVFGPVVNNSHTAAGVRAFTQTPGTTSPEFEFFDDFDAFIYDAMRRHARAASYLGRAGPAGVSRAALHDAIRELSKAQGPNPARWRAPMPQIAFQALEVTGIGTIPWENRGTWGQAVALPRLR